MSGESLLRRPWWSSLAVKLFGSYLVVVAVGIGTLVVAASYATPSFFDLRMAQTMGGSGAGMMGRGMGRAIQR